MANSSHIFGVRPMRYIDGTPWNGATEMYGFSASDSSVAYKGDLVTIDTTNRATLITDPLVPLVPVLSAVTSALTTTAFRGVIAGFLPQPEFSMSPTASLGTMYRLASTARYAMVVQDTTVVFEAEESGNSYVSATSNAVNKCMDITYAAGSNLTGISGVTLSGSATTSGAKPWRILRYTQRPDNFGFTASDTNSYAHFDILLANSDLAQANVGA